MRKLYYKRTIGKYGMIIDQRPYDTSLHGRLVFMSRYVMTPEIFKYRINRLNKDIRIRPQLKRKLERI